MKLFGTYSIALTLASAIALAACATSSHSSHVLTGTARPAIAPGEVSPSRCLSVTPGVGKLVQFVSDLTHTVATGR